MSKAWEGGSDTRWRAFRATILDRDRWLCTIKGQGCTLAAEQVDHVIPLSMGGPKYDPANCRASCAHCNVARGNRHHPAQPEPRPSSSW